MKVLLQHGRIIVIPLHEEERIELESWKSEHQGLAFLAVSNSGSGATLVSLGQQEEACRVPINVTSASPSPINLIANFAPTPFELDGRCYACVEAFWQSLRFPPAERSRIAALDGNAAKRESETQPYQSTVTYEGRSIAVGTFDHWQLMRRACKAKFKQNASARAALLGTGERPLVHIVRRDSRTIPGVIMADIWMKIRRELGAAHESESEP